MSEDITLIPKGRKLPKSVTAVNVIAVKLLDIFADHIGEINSISKDDLFKILYNHYPNTDDLADYLRWDFTRKAMHLLRQRSNCFIVNKYNREENSEFFVVKTSTDAQFYIRRLDHNILSMKIMQKRCLRAVEEKWYDQRFSLSYKPLKKIILKDKI